MKQLSLYELNKIIQRTLDTNLEPSYWVVAEIGEMRSNQNGHCYLELVEKEHDKVTAKIRGTIWSYTFRNLSTWFQGMTGQPLQQGLKVLCNVTVQFHELYGLSVNVRDIDANFTLGERARKRKLVIDQLIADGIFEMNKSHHLPPVPQRIAVISSPTAAGWGDFMDHLTNNAHGYRFTMKLYKASMQGEKAAESIIGAMMHVFENLHHYDAIIIIRGGGSQIDLDCFDDYELASHIAQFPLPVITGIGHERDESIADLVAHTRMKTPTAVAEFLISGIKAFDERLEEYYARIYHRSQQIINLQSQKLSTLGYQLKAGAKEKLSTSTHGLSHLSQRLKINYTTYFSDINKKLDLAEKSLNLLDPQTILKRGYTITTLNGKLLSNTTPHKGDVISSETHSAVITSTVESLNKKDVKKER